MKKTFLLMIICAVCASAFAVLVELEDSNYVMELYAEYDTSAVGIAGEIAIGPEGNLYVTHMTSTTGYNGSIVKVDADGYPTLFVDNLTRPIGIIWAGGTDYGENLYVTEAQHNGYYNKGGVTRIGMDGTIERLTGWSNGLNQPVSLGIDRTGNYGGSIFIGNGAADDIDRISPTGAVTPFSPFPYNLAGSPSGIGFDTTGKYSGAMFVCVASSNIDPMEGLYRLDTKGNPTRFVEDFTDSSSIAFDDTEGSVLGGLMYAVAHKIGIKRLHLFSVNPDGSSKLIVRTGEYRTYMAPSITIGMDGAIYMLIKDNVDKTALIYKITIADPIIPEIWKLEEAIADKRAAIVSIDAAMDKEIASAEMLAEMDGKQLHKAMMRILQAIQRETNIKNEIEKSINSLQEAVDIMKSTVQG